MKTNRNTSKNMLGFTLIELMLSASIMVILSGALLMLINPSAIRAKARDGQRVSDVRVTQSGLEIYFSEYRSYPESTPPDEWQDISDISALLPYMDELPSDPQGGTYLYRSDGSYYNILAEMEIDTSANGRCYGYSDFENCYGVENP